MLSLETCTAGEGPQAVDLAVCDWGEHGCLPVTTRKPGPRSTKMPQARLRKRHRRRRRRRAPCINGSLFRSYSSWPDAKCQPHLRESAWDSEVCIMCVRLPAVGKGHKQEYVLNLSCMSWFSAVLGPYLTYFWGSGETLP